MAALLVDVVWFDALAVFAIGAQRRFKSAQLIVETLRELRGNLEVVGLDAKCADSRVFIVVVIVDSRVWTR
eukprot:CAMPEP_0197052162 /NCGR_PEP_ID=MMETSP1384-20130603/26682_1 /TAXON_ID=29189 /ORGANISM="Ammonia sp." /LENGTH=70 /DNA_ID=CAMNT_0042484823 /DNA_START=70 /DNA_END=279 /DNA_ORIENTATION=+